jgi:hypothetical protein
MGVWCLLVGGNIHGDGGVGMFYALQVFFMCFTSFFLSEQVLGGALV